MPRYHYRYRRPQRRRIRLRWFFIALVLILLVAYPFMEPFMLNVEEHTLRVANLPQNLRNLKIVYATDFHQGPWMSRRRVEDVFNTINSLSADIVILGGDYAEDAESAIAFFENPPTVHARLGVFAVLGDSDRSEVTSELTRLVKLMQDAGITPLVNSVARAKVGQSYVYVAGSDDHFNGFPDVDGLAKQVYADDFVIFAGHCPDLMPDVLKAKDANGDNHWFDLALFGHTHGGQVSFMGHTLFGGLMPEVGSRYLSGWLEENRAAVLISNGVGTTGAPVRLFAPPQVHLITLKAR